VVTSVLQYVTLPSSATKKLLTARFFMVLTQICLSASSQLPVPSFGTSFCSLDVPF
jgi:hypothetical protein